MCSIFLTRAGDVIRNQGALSKCFVKVDCKVPSYQEWKEPVVKGKKKQKTKPTKLLEAESVGKMGSGICSVRDSAHLLGLSFIKFSA